LTLSEAAANLLTASFVAIDLLVVSEFSSVNATDSVTEIFLAVTVRESSVAVDLLAVSVSEFFLVNATDSVTEIFSAVTVRESSVAVDLLAVSVSEFFLVNATDPLAEIAD